MRPASPRAGTAAKALGASAAAGTIKGIRAVYCSLDPATAVLEKRRAPDVQGAGHGAACSDRADGGTAGANIHVVRPEDVPNPNWLRPGMPSDGQQGFGDRWLGAHGFVLIPSSVFAAELEYGI